MDWQACLILIATILHGEAPIDLMGPEAAKAVVWTVRNRMETWGWDCQRISLSYYGRGQPTSEEINLVREVFSEDKSNSNRMFFALSRSDVRRLKFHSGDLIYSARGFEIHLYSESPWRQRRENPP
jgi:hypothetical protein